MRSLTLTLTEPWNLGHGYCYARDTRPRMAEEVVDHAIDFLLAHTGLAMILWVLSAPRHRGRTIPRGSGSADGTRFGAGTGAPSP